MTESKMEDTQSYETIQKEGVKANAKLVKKGTATILQWILLVPIILTVGISTTALFMAPLRSKALLELKSVKAKQAEMKLLIRSVVTQLNNLQAKSEIFEMELANQKEVIAETETLQQSIDENQNWLAVQGSTISFLTTMQSSLESRVDSLHPNISKYFI